MTVFGLRYGDTYRKPARLIAAAGHFSPRGLLGTGNDLLNAFAERALATLLREVACGRERSSDLRGMSACVRQSDAGSDAFVAHRAGLVGRDKIVDPLRNRQGCLHATR